MKSIVDFLISEIESDPECMTDVSLNSLSQLNDLLALIIAEQKYDQPLNFGG